MTQWLLRLIEIFPPIHTLKCRPYLWIGMAEDRLFFWICLHKDMEIQTEFPTESNTHLNQWEAFHWFHRETNNFFNNIQWSPIGSKLMWKNVQQNVVIQHFWILNEFTILTDGYFNPFQVILKLWFILPHLQSLHDQLSGHEEKFRLHTNICCHDLMLIFSVIPFAYEGIL